MTTYLADGTTVYWYTKVLVYKFALLWGNMANANPSAKDKLIAFQTMINQIKTRVPVQSLSLAFHRLIDLLD